MNTQIVTILRTIMIILYGPNGSVIFCLLQGLELSSSSESARLFVGVFGFGESVG